MVGWRQVVVLCLEELLDGEKEVVDLFMVD